MAFSAMGLITELKDAIPMDGSYHIIVLPHRASERSQKIVYLIVLHPSYSMQVGLTGVSVWSTAGNR